MKVLFLTDGVHPFVIGGMQSHSLSLAIALSKLGVQIDLVHCGGTGYSPEEFCKIFSSDIREILIPFPSAGKLPGHYLRESVRYSRAIWNSVRADLNTYDIIYSQGFTGIAFGRGKTSNPFSAPLLVNLHGFEMFQQAAGLKVKLQQLVLRPIVRELLKSSDRVYSFGGKIDLILKSQGVASEKIMHQSNAIASDWITSDLRLCSPRSFVFVGRYERRKGIEELNQAVQELIRRGLPFRFSFVGNIPEHLRLAHEKVTYHNAISDRDQLKAVLDASDCLVCPSFSEGMPTVILEAMSRGNAIIATDVGAVSQMVNGNGILLTSPAVCEIQKAIQHVIEVDDAEMMKLKNRSIELIGAKFLWENVARQKLKDFESLRGKAAT